MQSIKGTLLLLTLCLGASGTWGKLSLEIFNDIWNDLEDGGKSIVEALRNATQDGATVGNDLVDQLGSAKGNPLNDVSELGEDLSNAISESLTAGIKDLSLTLSTSIAELTAKVAAEKNSKKKAALSSGLAALEQLNSVATDLESSLPNINQQLGEKVNSQLSEILDYLLSWSKEQLDRAEQSTDGASLQQAKDVITQFISSSSKNLISVLEELEVRKTLIEQQLNDKISEYSDYVKELVEAMHSCNRLSSFRCKSLIEESIENLRDAHDELERLLKAGKDLIEAGVKATDSVLSLFKKLAENKLKCEKDLEDIVSPNASTTEDNGISSAPNDVSSESDDQSSSAPNGESDDSSIFADLLSKLSESSKSLFENLLNATRDGAAVGKDILEDLHNSKGQFLADVTQLGKELSAAISDALLSQLNSLTDNLLDSITDLEGKIEGERNSRKRKALRTGLAALKELNSSAFKLKSTLLDVGSKLADDLSDKVNNTLNGLLEWGDEQLQRVNNKTAGAGLQQAATIIQQLLEQSTQNLLGALRDLELQKSQLVQEFLEKIRYYAGDTKALIIKMNECLEGPISGAKCVLQVYELVGKLNITKDELETLLRNSKALVKTGLYASKRIASLLKQLAKEKLRSEKDLNDIIDNRPSTTEAATTNARTTSNEGSSELDETATGSDETSSEADELSTSSNGAATESDNESPSSSDETTSDGASDGASPEEGSSESEEPSTEANDESTSASDEATSNGELSGTEEPSTESTAESSSASEEASSDGESSELNDASTESNDQSSSESDGETSNEKSEEASTESDGQSSSASDGESNGESGNSSEESSIFADLLSKLSESSKSLFENLLNATRDGAALGKDILEDLHNSKGQFLADITQLGKELSAAISDALISQLDALTDNLLPSITDLEGKIKGEKNPLKRNALRKGLTALKELNSSALTLKSTLLDVGSKLADDLSDKVNNTLNGLLEWGDEQLQRVNNKTAGAGLPQAANIIQQLLEQSTQNLLDALRDLEVQKSQLEQQLLEKATNYKNVAQALTDSMNQCLSGPIGTVRCAVKLNDLIAKVNIANNDLETLLRKSQALVGANLYASKALASVFKQLAKDMIECERDFDEIIDDNLPEPDEDSLSDSSERPLDESSSDEPSFFSDIGSKLIEGGKSLAGKLWRTRRDTETESPSSSTSSSVLSETLTSGLAESGENLLGNITALEGEIEKLENPIAALSTGLAALKELSSTVVELETALAEINSNLPDLSQTVTTTLTELSTWGDTQLELVKSQSNAVGVRQANNVIKLLIERSTGNLQRTQQNFEQQKSQFEKEIEDKIYGYTRDARSLIDTMNQCVAGSISKGRCTSNINRIEVKLNNAQNDLQTVSRKSKLLVKAGTYAKSDIDTVLTELDKKKANSIKDIDIIIKVNPIASTTTTTAQSDSSTSTPDSSSSASESD
ncbi:uncharacterized protein LOC111592627 [Drosophila hydei]|uniref:Uncharacterized protein LOC111592627 n=1 Tax=Drosophila hydei TaxID=7224 RepID=A0A6J2SPP5_DROHY|nr:uncharacterized protein LOC111592627 [Drosophila hydei]